jgi:DNA-binding MarR family transcriptional regulator
MSSATKPPEKKAPASEQDDVARDAWVLMYELISANRPKFMAICREHELFPPQVMVLRELEEPKQMGEIAELLACDSSNVTGITDRLEERGLVRRTAAEKDRRVKLLVLTDEGRRVRNEIVARMTQPPPEITGLPRAELKVLKRVLGRALDSRP